jgi:Holliday junction resolvasome RuvABC endonuclease subunit
MKRTKKVIILPSRLHEEDEAGKVLRILALDPATHCGYAISHSLYGVWNLTVKRDESAGMRLIRLRSKLNEIIQSEHINLVVFERPGGRFKSSIIVQSEIQGQIKTVCEDNKVQYRAYSSTEIKKFATGKGNCGKPAMIKAAQEKLNYPGDNDNEADALWILELAKNDYK